MRINTESCMRLSRRERRFSAGQALIEMAFMLPAVLLLLLGVIEIGRYAYISILVSNAARAGAAYGARGLNKSGDTTGITNAATYDFAGATSGSVNGLSTSTLSVTSFYTCGCDSAGTISSDTTGNCNPTGPAPTCSGNWVVTLHVTAQGSGPSGWNSLFNYPGIPSSLAISRTATMRVAPITVP